MEEINNLTQEQSDYINKATIAGVLGPLYAIAAGLYKEFWMFLIPFYNIYLFIKLIIKGRKMAWEKSNKDYEYFTYHQKNLSKIAKILLGIFFGFFLFEFLFVFSLFFGGSNSMFGKDVAINFTQNIFINSDVSNYVVSTFEPNQEYLNFEKDTRGEYKSVFFNSFSSKNGKSEIEGSVDFTNTSFSICVSLEKVGKEWKVFDLSESCE